MPPADGSWAVWASAATRPAPITTSRGACATTWLSITWRRFPALLHCSPATRRTPTTSSSTSPRIQTVEPERVRAVSDTRPASTRTGQARCRRYADSPSQNGPGSLADALGAFPESVVEQRADLAHRFHLHWFRDAEDRVNSRVQAKCAPFAATPVHLVSRIALASLRAAIRSTARANANGRAVASTRGNASAT